MFVKIQTMFPGSCFGVLRCVIYVLSTSAIGAAEERVLMLVREGNGVNVESVWNQTGNTHPADLNPLLPVEELIPLTLVRSPHIDDWNNPPDRIHIRTFNDQGDILWEMVFGVPIGTGPALPDLLVASNILSSSSPVSASTVDISWSKQSYQLYIGSTLGTNLAWLGVFNGPLTNASQNQYPVFLVPRSSDVPLTLAIESSSNNVAYTYEGCWPFDALTRTYGAEDFQYMTLQLCADHCRALSLPRMLLEMGYKCQCGDFSNSPTGRVDSQCFKSCNGDTSSPFLCGGNSNVYAVYPVPDALPFQYSYEGCWGNSNLNMQNYLSKPYMTVTMCNNVCSPRNSPLFIIQA
ncbi:uncharacterized protein LOC110441549, partial [Mizuhopecten yessoensis]|uniref:uncharacterized protein LOC110441549 n=1 Tax=Mizuhopecten yessoensis TaxID=6573 RepID=UPI000B4580DA